MTTIDEIARIVQEGVEWTPDEQIKKAIRQLKAIQHFEQFFSPRETSLCADRLAVSGYYFATEAPGADIDRLTLFAYNGQYYSISGSIIVAQTLEKIRAEMLDIVGKIRAKNIPLLKEYLQRTNNDKLRREIQKIVTDLPKLEIKQSFRDEVCTTLTARNIVKPMDVNVPPDGYLFAIALKNGILLGKLENGKMGLELTDFTPSLRITRQLSISLTITESTITWAKEWYQFSTKCFGEMGAMQFYQVAGYSLITKYPLPNERMGIIIVGDPGTGKGTHLAALEQIFRNGAETFYAHVTPHKLTDPREHFSRQNLRNKMMLIAGDLPHTTIPDYSKVNDLLGGESTEIEQKFKDPITEIPTFKVIWASAPPLHRVKKAGGAFRRFIIIQTRSVAVQDNDLKPKLLSKDALEGFFLNMLIGLATLAENNFRYTNEPTNDKIEELWEYLADSVGIYIGERLEPSLEEGDAKPVKEVYNDYVSWCGRKQIEPVEEKTFAKRLKDYGEPAPIFIVKKKKIDGKAINCAWARYQEEEGIDKAQTTLDKSEPDEVSLKSFISRLPEIHDIRSDLHGQHTRVRNEILNSYIKECHNESEPTPSNSGSPINQPPQEQKFGSDSGTGSQKEEGKSSDQPEPSLPPQEPDPDPQKDDKLNQKAIDFFRALKDKFGFFRPLEEHLATREPDNVIRYLYYEEGLNEDDSKAIISKWEELGLAHVVQNQIVSKNQAQEVNENGNH